MTADPFVLAWCAGSLAVAGVVKGLTGIGIPMVSIALLSLAIEIPEAVALLPVPILVANLWQGVAGGHMSATVRRFWPLILALVAGTAAGAWLLTGIDQRVLQIAIGSSVSVFALAGLADQRVPVPRRVEPWLGAVAGGLGGLLGGVSTLYGPPILLFLVTLDLSKDAFVGAISALYLVGAVALLAVFVGFSVMGPGELAWSALATAPLFAGVLVGQRLRDRVSQARFRRILLWTIALIGASLALRAM